MSTKLDLLRRVVTVAAIGSLAYHHYKRRQSQKPKTPKRLQEKKRKVEPITPPEESHHSAVNTAPVRQQVKKRKVEPITPPEESHHSAVYTAPVRQPKSTSIPRPIIRRPHDHIYYTIEAMKSTEEGFIKAVRMSLASYEILYDSVIDHLQKDSIPLESQLIITLLYLAHGGPTVTYSTRFGLSRNVVVPIIYKTTVAIWNVLKDAYFVPPGLEEWRSYAETFEANWSLPNCLGILDCRQIKIFGPAEVPRRRDVGLLAVVGADGRFLYMDVVAGRDNEYILRDCEFAEIFDGPSTGQYPTTRRLKGKPQMDLQYYFNADDRFTQAQHVMRPITDDTPSPQVQHFNDVMAEARQPADNAFGIVAARWRVIVSWIYSTPGSMEAVLRAVLVLHNFLMSIQCEAYCPEGYADKVLPGQMGKMKPGAWRTEAGAKTLKHFRFYTQLPETSRSCLTKRLELTNYLYYHK